MASAFVLDEQGEADLLQEALRNVRDQAFRMKRAVDAGELHAVLRHAGELLRELRTSLLSPKNYYQLYMQVLDELRHLESYFEDLQRSGTPMRSLYERVQSSGNVLPRLYLLVTVGSVYIKTKEAPAREILTDLVEMTKGVQYPLRGLFLRNYLSISVKDKLPDVGSDYERAGGGSTDDSIAFLLHNLSETNQLWIRMQYQKAGVAAAKNKAAREKERQDLRVLVGTSLVRLSQLEGVTTEVYSAKVLPKLLEIIIGCKDAIAQQYLVDCIIQVFPDEFHLRNLEKLLHAMGELHVRVDIAVMLSALVERLTTYFENSRIALAKSRVGQVGESTNLADGEIQQNEVFRLLMSSTSTLLAATSIRYSGTPQSSSDKKENSKMDQAPDANTAATPLSDSAMKFFVVLANFALKCFTTSMLLLEQVAQCLLAFVKARTWSDKDTQDIVIPQVKEFVTIVMQQLSVQEIMKIKSFLEVLQFLPFSSTRKVVAIEWIKILLERKQRIIRVADMEFVVEVLAPVIRDDPNGAPVALEASSATRKELDAFEREQLNLSKIIHLVCADTLDAQFQIFSVARRAFGQGGVFRIRYTLVPLIYRSLALAREVSSSSQECVLSVREVLQFVHEMVTALASKLEQMSVTCVSLFLQCALVADGANLEAIAYEFITQAFIVYEDQITNSREQWRALELMISSLRVTQHLSEANYDVLAAKTTQYAARLLKKNEQASMVVSCAHLFWHPQHQDGKRVLECLQRALRITDGMSGSSASQVPLFIDILEAYVYFFEMQTPEVTRNYLKGLVALVQDHLANMEHGQTRNESEFRFRDVLRYMDSKGLTTSA